MAPAVLIQTRHRFRFVSAADSGRGPPQNGSARRGWRHQLL